MSNRFSLREFGLLMTPVVSIGLLALWMSKRPKLPLPAVSDGKLHPQFHIEAPSALEAFRGANAAFVIDFKGPTENFYVGQMSGYIQVQTPRGLETARMNAGGYVPWDRDLCVTTSQSNNSTRFLLRTAAIPVGEAHFGFFGVAQPSPRVTSSATTLPFKPLRLSGKWKVNRTQFKPSSIASWPRKPLVVVREVRITQISLVKKRAGGPPSSVTGQVIFDLQSAAMNEKTSFENSFSEHHFVPHNKFSYGISYSTGKPLPNPRARVREWTVYNDSPLVPMNVSGRASADNRWPLGFQIEPFNFKTAKVGQKLKFKTFLVPLPKFDSTQ